MLRLSVRTLFAHKLRFLMTTFAVVLGVSFVVGSLVVTDTLRRSFDTLFTEINAGIDLEVRSESSFTGGPGEFNREPLPAEIVDLVLAVPGVAEAEGGVSGFAQPVDGSGEPVTTLGAPLLGVSWGDSETLAPLTLASGAKPSRPGEIALDAATFADHDFELGQQVDVLLAGGRESFTLVGTATFGTSNSLAGARLTMFEPTEAQRVFDRVGQWDLVDIAVADGFEVEEVRTAIAAVLPEGLEVVTGQTVIEEGVDEIGAITDIFGNILLGFAGVALFVSAFYIYNTFSIILGQRVRELGLLRALGASRSQLRRSVVTESVIVGALASVLGIGGGMLTAQVLRAVLNAGGLGLPADSLVLRRGTLIAAVVVGIGVTVVAALLPARAAASVPPVTAISGSSMGTTRSRRSRLVVGGVLGGLGAVLLTYGLFQADNAPALITGLGGGAAFVFLGVAMLSPLVAGPVARVVGLPVQRVFGVPGRLARQNAARNPYRTASTASALVVGLALVTMALVVGNSVKATFTDIIDDTVLADYIVTEPSFNGFSPELTAAIDSLAETGPTTGIRVGTFRFGEAVRAVSGAGPAADQLFDIGIVSGGSMADLGPDGILIHRDPARDLDLGPGDEVSVEFARTGRQTFTVVGIHSEATLAGNYVISLEAWDRHFTDRLDQLLLTSAAQGVDTGAAEAAIRAAAAAYPHLDIEDNRAFRERQIDQVDQLLLIVNALLGLAVVIAVLGIANTLALSVVERTRELGLLRAVGMSRRQLRRMVRWEAAVVSTFGALVGVVVGLLFGLAAATALPDTFLSRIAVPVGQLALVVAVAVFAGLAAAILPARRAARLDVLRAISSE